MTLEKLAAIKFRQIHQIVAEERTMGTGAWFKARKEVQDWWDIPNSFLWARGARKYPNICPRSQSLTYFSFLSGPISWRREDIHVVSILPPSSGARLINAHPAVAW